MQNTILTGGQTHGWVKKHVKKCHALLTVAPFAAYLKGEGQSYTNCFNDILKI